MGFQYTVAAGDCLSSLASKNGLPSWRLIWEHGNNADLRARRANPNVVAAGDSVYIPAGEKTKLVDRPVDKRHPFQIEKLPTFISIRVNDALRRKLPPCTYTLTVGGTTQTGKVPDNGVVTVKIDPEETTGQLVVTPDTPGQGFDGFDLPLSLGQLDPKDTVTGVQARLNNLGFHSGAVDGVLGPLTQHAIRSFQSAMKLPVDGQNSAAVQDALHKQHGC